MSISTYPNKFTSDGTYSDTKFVFNFIPQNTNTYEVTKTNSTDISNSIYLSVSTPDDKINVKLGDNVDNFYTFSGIYITSDRDIMDNNDYKYAFIIECTNLKLNGDDTPMYNKLYISIPAASNAEDTSMNTLFDIETSIDGTIKTKEPINLNQYIPIENQFYTYVTTGIGSNIKSQVILYKESSLSMKPILLGESSTTNPITTPLTVSSNKAVQLNYISNSSISDIYISCQPIYDENEKTTLSQTSYTDKVSPFIIPIITFIMIFGILYIILIYFSKPPVNQTTI